MALPITPTPILKGKSASNFLHKIERDLKKPLTYVSTPKLEQAKKIIKEKQKELSKEG